MHKASLICIDDERNCISEPVCHHFGEELHRTVLEGDGSEFISPTDAFTFREEDEVGSIQAIEFDRPIEQAIEQPLDNRLEQRPESPIKGGPETVRTWTRVLIHGKEGRGDFIRGERIGEAHASDVQRRV